MNDLSRYRDFIKPRGLGWVVGTLRVVVAVQCFGVAASSLSLGEASPVVSFLSEEFTWPAEKVTQVDRIAAYAMIACGVLTLLRPCWPVLLPVTGWMGAAAAAIGSNEPSAVLESIEHAVRVTAPLVLMLLDFWPPRLKSYLGRCFVSVWLLRLAVVATFAAHGLTALFQSIDGGPLVDSLIVVCGKSLGMELTEAAARPALAILGAVDLGLAMNVLFSRSRGALLIAALLGFALAASRVVEGGAAAYPEFLIRIAHGGLPLALLLYYNLCVNHPQSEVIPTE